MKERFVAMKRTAVDGLVWWYVFDNKTHHFSTYICHGKYKTKRDCNESIDYCNRAYNFEEN